ncbi:MAG: LysR family transcriptional regulator [Pyrinomonadaceae bacterium]|nr:LysR family transcriptional regulator [Pyrinomonadaceae bacterium]
MEIIQLKALSAIAETGSLEAAADSIGVSIAEAGMLLSSLEEEMHLQLILNSPDRTGLTENGAIIIDGARKILRAHNDLLQEAAELAGSKSSRLKIGSASAMFTTEQLPEILNSIRDQFPDAEIDVQSGTSEVLVNRILRGEVDVAFVSLPVENIEIKTDLLFSDEIVAIAHPAHKLANESIISAATLAGERLILGEKGGNTRRMIDELFESASVKPNVVMELSRQESIVKMVENDLGVGLAGSKNISRKVREGSLVSWFIEGAEIKWNLGLATMRGGFLPAIAKEFIRLCHENFAEKEKAFEAENNS